ncbi:MAG: hypothetical protein JWN40_5990 [Phycisphaerales bacterium]|nr:hypothetical protein [Phycisphaerales bacterium]
MRSRAIITSLAAILALLSATTMIRAQGVLGQVMRSATQPVSSPAAATSFAAQPFAPIPGQPQRFDAFNGLFKLMLPPGWTLVGDRAQGNRYKGQIAGGSAGTFWFNAVVTSPGVSPRTLVHILRSDAVDLFPNTRIIEEGETRLGTLEGYLMACDSTEKAGSGRVRVLILVARDDRHTFAFTAVMPVARYDLFRRELDSLSNSFEISGMPVDFPDGRYRLLLPPDAKLEADPKNPRRQIYRIAPSAVIIFEFYTTTPTNNAATFIEYTRKTLPLINTQYKELEIRKATPDLRVGLINGHFLETEYTGKDGVRWRNATYCCDEPTYIYSATFIAQSGPAFEALLPAAQRIITSFNEYELVATGEDPDMRTVTAATGDFEITLPRAWSLLPTSAEEVPHVFVQRSIGEGAAIASYILPIGGSIEQELAAATKSFERGAEDLKVVADADVKLGPLAARQRLIDVTRDDGVVYRVTFIIALHGPRAFSFWVRTPLERMPVAQPIIDKISRSFALVAPADPDKFTVYQDKEHRFSLKYPDAMRPVGAFGVEIVRIAIRPSGPAVRYLDNVVIGLEMSGKHPEITLDQAADNYSKSRLRWLTGGAVGQWRDVTVGGEKAKRIIYNETVTAIDRGPVNVTKMVILVIHDQQIYCIRVQARQPNFDLFVATGQKVVDSIEWPPAKLN